MSAQTAAKANENTVDVGFSHETLNELGVPGHDVRGEPIRLYQRVEFLARRFKSLNLGTQFDPTGPDALKFLRLFFRSLQCSYKDHAKSNWFDEDPSEEFQRGWSGALTIAASWMEAMIKSDNLLEAEIDLALKREQERQNDLQTRNGSPRHIDGGADYMGPNATLEDS